MDIIKMNFHAWKEDLSPYLLMCLEGYLIVLVLAIGMQVILVPLILIMVLLFTIMPTVFFASGSSAGVWAGLLTMFFFYFVFPFLLALLISPLAALMNGFYFGGLCAVIKKIFDGERPSFGDVFKGGKTGLKTNFVMAYFFIICILLLAFIIPIIGSYLGMLFIPVLLLPFVIHAEEGIGAVASIKKGFKFFGQNKGRVMMLGLFYFLAMLIGSMLGPLAMVVQLVGIPFLLCCLFTMYRGEPPPIRSWGPQYRAPAPAYYYPQGSAPGYYQQPYPNYYQGPPHEYPQGQHPPSGDRPRKRRQPSEVPPQRRSKGKKTGGKKRSSSKGKPKGKKKGGRKKRPE